MDRRLSLLSFAAVLACNPQMPEADECFDLADDVRGGDYPNDGMAEITCLDSTEQAGQTFEPELCQVFEVSGGTVRLTLELGELKNPNEDFALIADYSCGDEPGESVYGSEFEHVSSGSNAGGAGDHLIVSTEFMTKCREEDTIEVDMHVVPFDLKRPGQACDWPVGSWFARLNPDGTTVLSIFDNGYTETRELCRDPNCN